MTEQTTVRTIVAGWLREHGHDGLLSPRGCGCGIDDDDLMSCHHFCQDCVPGYRWTCPCEWRERDYGEQCPDPYGEFDDGCYRAERQPDKEDKS